ncbi:MAG: acyltransferase, partial [Rhizobium pusense]|nr:acyltransferase [Agrobacterium pusense]
VLLLGGRIGVDLFFVLSGFLITSTLLQEQRLTGSISLTNFYMRRVLRLAPALVTVVAFVMTFVWLDGTPEQTSLAVWNSIGTLLYFFNWQVVWEAPNVLNHERMYSHIWSLSVEEQFYTVWPLMVVGMFTFGAPRRAWLALALLGIFVPSVWRALRWLQEPSPSVYLQTHLRADGLMWGALAAILIDLRIMPTGKLRKLASWAGFPALLGLFAIASFEGLKNGFFYLAGFALVGLCSSVLIYTSVVCPLPPLAQALAFRPLRWIGAISYGLYLWHWPIIRMVAGWELPQVAAITAEYAITFAIATVSYYSMEQPILRLKERFRPEISPSVAGRALRSPA